MLRQGDDETPVLEAGDAPVVALAADRNRTSIWAADVFANLARSTDGGKTWSPVEIPWTGQQLLALVAAEGGLLPIAATHDADSGSMTVVAILGRPMGIVAGTLRRNGPARHWPLRRAKDVWAVIAGEVWAMRRGANGSR